MKASELRELSVEELQTKLTELKEELFNLRSAKLRHPANPQPPQLAPASTDSTSSMSGFSSTLNFFATKNRITAATPPKIPRITRDHSKMLLIKQNIFLAVAKLLILY